MGHWLSSRPTFSAPSVLNLVGIIYDLTAAIVLYETFAGNITIRASVSRAIRCAGGAVGPYARSLGRGAELAYHSRNVSRSRRCELRRVLLDLLTLAARRSGRRSGVSKSWHVATSRHPLPAFGNVLALERARTSGDFGGDVSLTGWLWTGGPITRWSRRRDCQLVKDLRNVRAAAEARRLACCWKPGCHPTIL